MPKVCFITLSALRKTVCVIWEDVYMLLITTSLQNVPKALQLAGFELE